MKSKTLHPLHALWIVPTAIVLLIWAALVSSREKAGLFERHLDM
jgi:hypothetical protein